ncbi:Protein TAPT1-like protein [Dinothrombium tinctorium]|uniref:Protein TAPT1-like protein n=1 Tax=Dinothrombium tinctorium TaxID=1965070 RepID=A0A3S4RAI0_9ACAR|nr:Protein TAPT1-like protein [Dinothrombium tinctorium]
MKATLFDYVYNELRRGYLLENDEQKYTERRQKFYAFMKVPKEFETFISHGFLQCLDAFLFVFTLLPLRVLLACWLLFSRSFKRTLRATVIGFTALQPAEKCDILKGVILILSAFLLSYLDTSMLYHMIKSQSVIKLYIFFNMLEVADKLFSSFGQDNLDALLWTATEPRNKKREHLGVLTHLVMAVGYVYLHSILVLLQATTLNVAINSKNKALLTIMLSNNFVELKGMVFKKFEKNNLFHMSCSDVRERLHYCILLIVVIIQTLKEYFWNMDPLWILIPNCIGILIAEVMVDWLKHAFITRFNEISHEVYAEYSISLAYDLASSKLKSAYSDHSDLISRRMGFIPLPLALLVFRIFSSSIPFNSLYGYSCIAAFYLCLLTFKCWLNIYLLGKACDLIEKHRASLEKKSPTARQCTSLPSSRHHSTENLPLAVANSKSTPHTPTPSQSSSLVDITEQAAIMQETLENSMVMSNSTVSLNSLEINDGSTVRLLEEGKENLPSKQKSILRQRFAENNPLKRRVSLQETRNYDYLNLS